MPHFETKSQNKLYNWLGLMSLPAKDRVFGVCGDDLVDAKGDEFHIFGAVKKTPRPEAFYQKPDPAKSNAGDDCNAAYDGTEEDDVYDQIANIVFFTEVSIFIPCDVGFVIYRRKQRFGFSL